MATAKALPELVLNIELGIPEDGKPPSHVRFTHVTGEGEERRLAVSYEVEAGDWRKAGSPMQLVLAARPADEE